MELNIATNQRELRARKEGFITRRMYNTLTPPIPQRKKAKYYRCNRKILTKILEGRREGGKEG